MKRSWKLSRGMRTVLNLVLCLPPLIGLWGIFGYPLPTMEMELHRWERTHLLAPSQVVFSAREDDELFLEDGHSVQLSCTVLVGCTEDHAVVCWKLDRGFEYRYLPLDGEPFAALAGSISMFGFYEGRADILLPVMAFCIPEEAASGEITVMAYDGMREVPLTGPGREIGPGVWLFATGTLAESWGLSGDTGYTMKFYRADGSLLLERKGTLN